MVHGFLFFLSLFVPLLLGYHQPLSPKRPKNTSSYIRIPKSHISYHFGVTWFEFESK